MTIEGGSPIPRAVIQGNGTLPYEEEGTGVKGFTSDSGSILKGSLGTQKM